jgi:serine protease Do
MQPFVKASRWLLPAVVMLGACGSNDPAIAQTRQQAREEVRERLGSVPATLDTATAAALSSAFRGAAERALPAVVYVAVEQSAQVAMGRSPSQLPIPEEFRRFFQFPDEDMPAQPQRGTGSGFIVDGKGLIVTNNHVVENATSVVVRLVDGREYDAEVVGRDPNTDVALLRIQPGQGEELPVATLGDSDQLRVGDWVLALGNPLGLDFTVTAGIVSAKGRSIASGQELPVQSFIQTDAAINMGNSGGPMVDLLGRVVGVNTAIFGGGSRFVGYGFAVPVNLVRKVVSDIERYGYARRPKLGAFVSDLTPADRDVYGLANLDGAEIGSVEPGAPAERAGLRVGDVVVALDGEQIDDANELISQLARREPGNRVRLTVVRDRQRRDFTVELGEFPRETQPRRAAPAGDAAEQTLGFTVSELTPRLAQQFQLERQTGVVITGVARFGAAQAAGVRPGQIVLRVNGEEVRSAADIARLAAGVEPGSTVSLRVVDPTTGETIINYRTRR